MGYSGLIRLAERRRRTCCALPLIGYEGLQIVNALRSVYILSAQHIEKFIKFLLVRQRKRPGQRGAGRSTWRRLEPLPIRRYNAKTSSASSASDARWLFPRICAPLESQGGFEGLSTLTAQPFQRLSDSASLCQRSARSPHQGRTGSVVHGDTGAGSRVTAAPRHRPAALAHLISDFAHNFLRVNFSTL
jgi:hypothetical protein